MAARARAASRLACLFTDCEPGIHYAWVQVQVQSGTIGINARRIYNPVKQSLDQEQQGELIRRQLPELESVPTKRIHTPWAIAEEEQRRCGVRISDRYALRIVDHEQSAREAHRTIGSARGRVEAA